MVSRISICNQYYKGYDEDNGKNSFYVFNFWHYCFSWLVGIVFAFICFDDTGQPGAVAGRFAPGNTELRCGKRASVFPSILQRLVM